MTHGPTRRRRFLARVFQAVALAALVVSAAQAQTPLGTAFTYQGRLGAAGAPANGIYDLRFILYDAPAGGMQVGPVVVKEDVAVAQGLFVVALDFGGGAFTGGLRSLEIAVRPGTSTGGFTVLGTRQELTPAPSALFSAAAPWTGVTGKPPGFADDVDNDVVAGLSCASGQVAKWNGTAWICAQDIDTNSGGTVTSVATGPGLTGGPITGSGTIAVATGGITSAMIANGAVGLAQINTAEVQARVTGTCPLGLFFRGVNPDGSVVCEAYLNPNVISTIGPGTGTTSIDVGTDGLPVVTFQDFNGTLRVAKCGNIACTAGNTITTVDPAPFVGGGASIAIGSDGLPVISYDGGTAFALKVAKCGNAACTAGNVITTVDDPANFVGGNTSIAIGSDGLPVVAYQDATAYALKVAKCGNAACSAGNTITTVDDPANDLGGFLSMAVGTDGRPVVSYHDDVANALKVAKCGNAACTAGNTITTLGVVGSDVGRFNAIAVAADGRPVVSFSDSTAQALKVLKCGNAACTAGNTITTVDDPGNDVSLAGSIAIGSDGLPVASYLDFTSGALKVVKCGSAACTAGNIITSVDLVGYSSSIAIGADGLPVIGYQDGNGAVKVAKCSTAACR